LSVVLCQSEMLLCHLMGNGVQLLASELDFHEQV
jgi:hypothetical protein